MLSIGNSLLSSTDLQDYKNAVNDAWATFSKKIITWQTQGVNINRYQEDIPNPFINTDLEVLCNYNYRRAWPLSIVNESGTDDEQSIQLYFNKEYLRVNNLLDENGNFIYNQDFDQFIIDGTIYKAFGDTPTAQLQDDDLFITIVVKRVQLPTDQK